MELGFIPGSQMLEPVLLLLRITIIALTITTTITTMINRVRPRNKCLWNCKLVLVRPSEQMVDVMLGAPTVHKQGAVT